ncbi:hypothetical protein C1645_857860 [Glomus cerebriforme]|uniref:Uncharacterized protein n=1 Tax=Glomus cerebriforme TaxID=658196 RepID=A0A397SI37_9GLOM|nr:hypothetical protein C1645_857860 [Glomus cerebriforme]
MCKDEINVIEEYFDSGLDENQLNFDKKKELVDLNNLAEGGNNGAQNNLGYYYKNGIGVTKDDKKAFEWYLKAANNRGDTCAQYNLGICYQDGTGINKNDEKAFTWYYESAKGEFSVAQNILDNISMMQKCQLIFLLFHAYG